MLVSTIWSRTTNSYWFLPPSDRFVVELSLWGSRIMQPTGRASWL
jgi:hypothetical protein